MFSSLDDERHTAVSIQSLNILEAYGFSSLVRVPSHPRLRDFRGTKRQAPWLSAECSFTRSSRCDELLVAPKFLPQAAKRFPRPVSEPCRRFGPRLRPGGLPREMTRCGEHLFRPAFE